MIKVIPAILPTTFDELTNTLERLKGVASTVQLDIVDGIFAPNRTWPYSKDGQDEFATIVSGENGFPFWKDFDFELDLMVKDALPEVTRWLQAGAARIVVHEKSTNALQALQSLQEFRGDGKGFISLGIALSSTASPNSLWQFEGLYDFVQVMGIKRIGFQGEPFDPQALECIREVRAQFPALSIGIDGGVRLENIEKLVAAGVNRLIVGSLIVADPDPRAALRRVIDTANHSRQ